MAERFSKSEIDRLGERIRASDRLSVEDLRMLQAWRAQHANALDHVVATLSALGMAPTARAKTPPTIVDKLKRERHLRLSQMQDIVGCRVVVEAGRPDQDERVSQILREYADARVMDRRAHPQNGYRAVHVVVPRPEGLVEIQVRTIIQDAWAQMFERMADLLGRDIRYGTIPEFHLDAAPWNPLHRLVPGANARIDRLVRGMWLLSDGLAEMEADSSLEASELDETLRILRLLDLPTRIAVRLLGRRFS